MMDKEERREQYYNKKRHQQQQKLKRKQKENLQECIVDQISQFDLKTLIDFLQTEYDTILNKNIQLGPQLNKAIAKQYMSIKRKWTDYHKQMFLDHLNARGLGVTEQQYKKLIKGEQTIYKRKHYGVTFYYQSDIRYVTFYQYALNDFGRRGSIDKNFWVPQGTELQQNEIFSKGFKNSALSQCQSLLGYQKRIDQLVSNGKR